MNEGLTKEVKKNVLKDIIKRLHAGEPVEEIKKNFKNILSHLTTTEITELEEELINEGLKREEILRLCDLHIELFKEAIEGEQTLAPQGHPINILMKEHRLMLGFTDDMKGIINEVEKQDSLWGDYQRKISQIIDCLKSSECHYLREENVLFPFLEKHGLTEPPKIMWMEHDKIREVKKSIFKTFDDLKNDFSLSKLEELKNYTYTLSELLSTHFYKENNILFSAAMRLIEKTEWFLIHKEFKEIGFTNFYTPEDWEDAKTDLVEERISEKANTIKFETGEFQKEELQCLLNTLPFDITFVDKDDRVKYFSDSKDRIFIRTKAILGRTVQQCHPSKSLHIVNKILDDFKSGKKTTEKFWINLHGKVILIQYFAVQDSAGNYCGCVEVTTDITDIKKIEGEKRLLTE